MKKVILFLGVLLSLGILSACSSDEEFDNESPDVLNNLAPTEEGDEYTTISNFFRSNHYIGTEYRNFFGNSDESQCLIINSTDELLSNYTGVDPFPNIDFNKYTLIVGQEMMSESFYVILRQELILLKGNMLILNLHVPKLEGGYCAIQHLFYWGLYPKIHSSKITVKIIKEQV